MRITWMAALLALTACSTQSFEEDDLSGLESALATDSDVRYIVKFRDEKVGRGLLQASGSRIEKELGPQRAVAARIPAHAAAALKKNKHFEFIEEDVKRMPLAQTTPYGVTMVQAPDVWSTATGANRTVCIIDSGFYVGHDDLQTSNLTGYPSDWNTDACGHGTHVAGTVAALNDSDGVVGVLPNGVKLHIIKVFGNDCSWTYSSDLVDALNRCVAAGANVVSMSLGGGRASTTEKNAFADAYSKGVLSIAAAGNDGTTALSYPASYPSVVSVGALDENKTIADFSQKNAEVDLSAPGVAVLSTVPWQETNSLTVDGVTYQANYIEGAARTSGVSGALVSGGLCDSVGSWSGKVVLCERGSISFATKVNNVKSGGGVAAIIYNNASGNFFGTLGDGVTSTIPALSLSQEDGKYLVANKLGVSGTVVSKSTKPASGYEAWNGTSMATPHVSAVAALVWSANTSWSNAQIRDALESTAQDLGTVGRDDAYGHGLVQAKAALDYLGGGGGTTNTPPTAAFTYSCSQLACSFTNGSTDSDGTITSYSWDFGDGTTSTAQNPSHTYAAAGTYTVTLTVTDDDAATGTTSKSVTVSTTTTEISLSATGYKVKGRQYVDLGWNGATSTSVDVFRNGARITTTANDGYHTDATGKRGGGSYTYKVCEAGTSTCSNSVSVIF